MPEIKELLAIAKEAARIAQVEILKHYQSSFTVEWKADQTPVTIADQKAEALIREYLKQQTPLAGFIGEEFGIENPEAAYQWIVDPIDGTKSFIHGVPLFGTLIALYKKGVPLVSLISLPALNSVLWASKGAGTYLDGQRVQLSTQHQLQDALVLSGTINTIENLGYGEAFKKIRTQARLYRGWGDCYGYYLAASGRADLMFDPVVSLWDIAPLPLLFQEAGGVFSTLSGEKELFDSEGKPVHSIYEGYTALAGSTLVQQKALSYFNP
ncbi:MAG: histidinol-phosphatase [Fibrobacter sp.]|jgi:myo-inositol-1(or 4)-monophosphatase|nr:histidinol-phosphatase [Fibrobacter sp.]